ncbi:universal stress protein [Agriterribacter humi]|uniref:universal stress protein n=1 Tax=Agriterribacter humi TaxID=1104781 RepID=UPI0012657484|nr:universal stress protein [Agriterribacter humi]
MKKIIAAVDFSEPSVNAAKYAIQLASDITDSTVTLYYVYETIVAGSDGTPLLIDPDARKNMAIAALSNLKRELGSIAGVPIDVVAEEGSLTPTLEKYVNHNHADLIVMGITGSSKLEQLIIGSNTLNVISKDICPVFIIPGTAVYQKIKNVILTSDLKNVEATTPVKPLKKFLDILQPQLYVLHITSEQTALPDEDKKESKKLEQLLQSYNPQYFSLLEENFTEAIDKFSIEHHADIIITVPRKHSFLGSLFKSSNTKKLAYQSRLPILALHSWE